MSWVCLSFDKLFTIALLFIENVHIVATLDFRTIGRVLAQIYVVLYLCFSVNSLVLIQILLGDKIN